MLLLAVFALLAGPALQVAYRAGERIDKDLHTVGKHRKQSAGE